jgi:hypothetical protein
LITGPAYTNAIKLILETRLRDDWLLYFDGCLDKKIADWECLHKDGTPGESGGITQEQFAELYEEHQFEKIVYCEFRFPQRTLNFLYGLLIPTMLKSRLPSPELFMVKDASVAEIFYQDRLTTLDAFKENADEYFTLHLKYFPEDFEAFNFFKILDSQFANTAEILEMLD